REVIDPHVLGLLAPRTAAILEQTDQLALLRVNADHGLPVAGERTLEPIDNPELLIPMLRGLARKPLPVEAKAVLACPQHSPRFGWTDLERAAHTACRLSGPLDGGHRIACRGVLHHLVQTLGQIGSFFSSGFRPAPCRRIRPSG